MKKVSVALIVFTLILGVFAIGGTVKYGGILKAETEAGPLTLNLNPFSVGSAWMSQPTIYETLFYVNPLNGSTTPFLGTSYKWTDNNLELIVTTRSGVEWTDGTPFTAKDVAFSFDYIKKFPAIDSSGLWAKGSGLESVEASGDNTVVFKFSTPNTPLFTYIAGTYIVPEHIWKSVADPTKYLDKNPVGTGPFLFKSFSSDTNTMTFVKNPNYWMKGKPYIDEVQIISSNSNNNVLLSMLKHETDFSNLYVPDVEKTWIGKDPQVNGIYWPVYSINALYLNTQKAPFDNPTFRKAVSVAINKKALDDKAYFGMGGTVNPTGIIPGQQNEWLDPTLASLSKSFDYSPAEAEKLLASIGYKKDAKGNLTGPDGKELPTYKILVGAGWTDYITMAQVISENLKALGISTVIDQQPFSTYMPSVLTGTYDMVISWGTGTGPTPYFYFYQEFSPSFSASKIGETVISDYSRYTNPIITSALQVYAQTGDLSLQKQAMYAVERVFLEDVPFIPLTNRTNFEIFSTNKFVGWPSESDPYNSGGNVNSKDAELIFLNVHLK